MGRSVGTGGTGGAVLAAAWVVRDYRGGWLGSWWAAHTARGWLTMAVLRARTWRVDPFDTTGSTRSGHLTDPVPERAGRDRGWRTIRSAPSARSIPGLGVRLHRSPLPRLSVPTDLDHAPELLREAQRRGRSPRPIVRARRRAGLRWGDRPRACGRSLHVVLAPADAAAAIEHAGASCIRLEAEPPACRLIRAGLRAAQPRRGRGGRALLDRGRHPHDRESSVLRRHSFRRGPMSDAAIDDQFGAEGRGSLVARVSPSSTAAPLQRAARHLRLSSALCDSPDRQ